MDLERTLILCVLDHPMLTGRYSDNFLILKLVSLLLYVLIRIFHLQEDFFFVLHNILAEMEEVSELHPVPDAHVPVMKFKLDGISIDLLYASISLLVVPDVSFSSSLLYNSWYKFLALACLC